MVSNSVKAKGS